MHEQAWEELSRQKHICLKNSRNQSRVTYRSTTSCAVDESKLHIRIALGNCRAPCRGLTVIGRIIVGRANPEYIGSM